MARKKKQQSSKGKKSKPKISATKVANKHLHKLAKQGKLKKQQNKQKRLDKLALKAKQGALPGERKNEQEHSVVPLEDDDLSYYGTPGHNTSFASSIQESLRSDQKGSAGKSKKRKREEPEEAENYERLPRTLFSGDGNKKMKMVLPIKTKKGIVKRMVEVEDSEEEQSEEADEPDHMTMSHEDSIDQSEPQSLPVLSGVELFVLRQQKIEERKQKMALLSDAVIENPEENIKRLRDLLAMLHEKDPDVFVTVRKYVMVSLLEVFNDIIPGYHIRALTEKEQQQRMKKETIALMSYESTLLKTYKEYLEFLEKTSKGVAEKTGKGPNKEPMQIPKKAQQGLMEVAVKCMCELLVNHPQFNYANNIIVVLVPYMNHKLPQVSDLVCQCVRSLFKNDKTGMVTLELTKCIGKLIKAQMFSVQPKVLDTFLSLRIKEVSYTDPMMKEEENKSKEDKKKKNHNDKLSRREKKRKKQMMFLERELSETKATEDKRRRLKLHTETIQAIFLTYFRILKKAPKSALIPSVLEGLAKFAHLINVDFFNDLFSVFNQLIDSGDLSYRESLHCVQTAFTILSGQGSVLNIDPMVFYRHLYRNLFHVHAGCTCGDVPIIMKCLDVMVNKRRRQVSQQRVLAFLKRLCTLTLQQTSAGCIALLSTIRTFITAYSYSDMLLDNETQGSGVYLPELDDPEHCHAHNTALWELSYLQRHFDPNVRKYSSHLSHGAPVTGAGQLPLDLRREPMKLYTQTEEEEVFRNNIPEKIKLKLKVRLNGLVQEDLSEDVLSTLHAVHDTSPSMADMT